MQLQQWPGGGGGGDCCVFCHQAIEFSYRSVRLGWFFVALSGGLFLFSFFEGGRGGVCHSSLHQGTPLLRSLTRFLSALIEKQHQMPDKWVSLLKGS